MISAEILEKALKTEGDTYDTGLRLRGYEVHALPPHRYRFCTTFFLVHPEVFATQAYQDGETRIYRRRKPS